MLRKGILTIGVIGITLGYFLTSFAAKESPASVQFNPMNLTNNLPAYTQIASPIQFSATKEIITKPNKQSVAFTFDDGPDPRYTPQILDILDKYNIKATFFMIGENAKRYPNLVKEVLRRGHSIGNHTMTHPMLRHLAVAQMHNEISQTSGILNDITGQDPICFRAPYGASNKVIDSYANSLGMQVIFWDVSSNDYLRKGVRAIENTVFKEVRPGSIILMHDGGGNRSQTVAALPGIIEKLKKDGLGFDQICV